MADEMRNAVRAHDRQRRIEPPLHQRRDFVERAVREHRVEPRVDPLAELRPIGREIEARPFAWRSAPAPRARRGTRRADAPSQSSTSSARKMRCRSLGLRRAAVSGSRAAKLVVKLRRGATLRLGSDLSPHGFGHGRDVRQALGQRAEIKPRAADENHRPFADLRQNLARGPRPSAGGKIDRAVDRAEQAMRREPLLVRRRPRGQDSADPGRPASSWR